MIRLLVADDQRLAREGLRQLLSHEPDIAFLGAARDGAELIDMAREYRPEVILTDLRMPGMDGITAIRRLTAREPDTAIIALTTFDTDEYLFGALEAGAVGFLLKDGDPDLYLAAVHAAHRGQGLIDPQVTRRLVRRFATPPVRDGARELTVRETQVLRLVALGRSNGEIADMLGIAPGTVKIHVSRVLAKIGTRTRVQAAIYAYRSGLLSPDE
ncbi:DNA-binding response regulator [Sphaerisporangium melleum]|uniref:DNA-binding response regulator n=1 Tax=Sphaerisporangium melleum TaxID=321316 RepID=A0A917RDG8_9ACTN|nr:response regulator transcription factor [Sphaerisporangium melleum]GGL01957.1 DNA-binding response regulator [Sphaerisporangium melleum]GII72192.1 DNA-binding response regulator [Sphaerisporangium melleum]